MRYKQTLKSMAVYFSLLALFICGASIVLPSTALADTGLVAHWTMDDGSGTIASDSSGYNNNATINGPATWVPGKIGDALSFNGSNNYARVATFNTTPSSTMTLCSWIKTSSATNQVILGFARNPSGFSNEGVFSVLADGSIQFWDDTGSQYGFPIAGNSSNGAVVDDGHWHSVCFVKNNTAGTYYIDGVENGTTTASTNIAYDNYDWVIGADYRDNDFYFNGLIDDTRVYDIALSSQQIAALYGIVGYWKFDEGTGTVAYDSSGDNNTGTIVGNPSWITGKLGDALEFGNNQYVSIGGGPISSAIASSGQMTATAWVYANSATASGTIIKNWPGDSSNDQFQLGFQASTGNISGYLKQSNGTVIGPVESTSSLPLNGWHLVAFTANGSSTILYIDGTAVASTTYNGTIDQGGNYIGIGADLNNTGLPSSGTPEYFNGGIDDVHLYNRGLLPEEILTLMEAPPAQVMNLQATGTHTSGFSLRWNANPVGDNVTDYLVQYSTNGGMSWTTVDTVSTSTSYELNNLAAGDYFFRVKAVNSVAQGAPSNQVEINSPVITYNLGNDCLALEHIANNPGDAYGHYVMSANIDCSVVPSFSPISFVGGFGGTFDGGGHTITNLYINTSSTNDVGLFGQIQNGGTVENLTLSNANVTTGGQYSGILAGYNNGTIQNVSVLGTSTGAYYVGGLVGQNDSLGTISSSSVNANVIGNNPNGGDVEYVGGFVGENTGSIDHSYSLETVTNATSSEDFYYAGGFAGYSDGVSLSYDYATGPVIVNPDSSQESDYIGGFVGDLGSSDSVDHSYATGNISDPDDYAYEVGGFVGDSEGTLAYDYATGSIYIGDDMSGDIYYVGGFVGGSDTNAISNCYSTGSVTAAFPQGLEYVGGFAGYNENPISNSYSTGNVEGYYEVGGFSGYSSEQLSEVYATGNVVLFGNNPTYGGGLVAYNAADIDDAFSTGNIILDSGITGTPLYMGGLVGYNYDANINRTYASGNIALATSSSEVGGLVGEDDQDGNVITNSYSVGAVSGGTDVGGLIGLESIQGSGNPGYADLSWYNGSASNVAGDFINNSGNTDNGPIQNLTTGGYGTDTSSTASFYLTSHPVYALHQGGGWDFSTIWVSHANAYPTFQWYTPPTYAIAASAGTGGAISPSGNISVTSGANQAFSISPNSGYAISNILVDGTPVGALSTYTFSDVTAAHTISVTFTQITPTQPIPAVGVGGGGGMIANACQDPRALNYNAFGASDPSLCQYANVSSFASASTGSIATLSTSSLPVATTTLISCSAQIYPTEPIKFGAKNDPAQVVLLQKYLNAYENAQLPVDGIYSAQDVAAVIAWQEKYASDILAPWNLTKGTGYIYITSLQKFKNLFLAQCDAGTQSSLGNSPLESDLQMGMSGEEVLSLQQALISKMVGPAARALAKNGASGYFGQLTKSALIEFQKSAGIVPALGYCGSETRAALGI